ncbi:MAG: hypothetical protein R3D63_10015 [Paracoccaceae bacterium]
MRTEFRSITLAPHRPLARAARRLSWALLAVVMFGLAFVQAAAAQTYIQVGAANASENLGATFTEVTSVTPSTNTPVNGAVFQLSHAGETSWAGNIFMEVRNGATVVASGSIARSIANANSTDYTITFAAPFNATAGTLYTIYMRTTATYSPSVKVKFLNPATLSGVNSAPTADAGSAQTVASGAAVTLDGTGSTDPDLGDTLT